MFFFLSFFFLLQNQRMGVDGFSVEEGFGTSVSKEVKGKGAEDEYGANNVYTCM
jgi:hypothetical protein